jgi:hypothetical protein
MRKTTKIATRIYDRARAVAILKMAGVLDGPAANFKERAESGNKAMTALMKPAAPAAPIKPLAPTNQTSGNPSRWLFDRPGSGDAQARSAIYDKTKQIGASIYNAPSQLGDYIGSKLPVSKPGNSGYGNTPAAPAASANTTAWGAAPAQGPAGSWSSPAESNLPVANAPAAAKPAAAPAIPAAVTAWGSAPRQNVMPAPDPASTQAWGGAPSHGPTGGGGINPQAFGAAPAQGPAPQLTVSGGQPLLPVSAWAGGPSQAPPATATQPTRPQQYRGQNEFGAQVMTPARAGRMKTWDQISQEQSINPADTSARKGIGQSLTDAITGGVTAAGSGALNLAGTIVGRPATYLYDKATGSNTNETLNDALTHLQDFRDRGLHQALYNTRSNALNDRLAANTEEINQNGTNAQKITNDVASSAMGMLPYVAAGGGGAAGSAAMYFGAPMADAAGITAPTQFDMQGATLTPGPNGATATMNTRLGTQNKDFSQLSPDQAAAFVADPKNDQALAGIWNAPGQLPNNLLTPAERVNNGQFDPATGQPVDLSSNRQRAPSSDQVAQGGQFNVSDQQQAAAEPPQDGSFSYNDAADEINTADPAGFNKFLPEDAPPEMLDQANNAAASLKQNPLAVKAVQDPKVAAQVTEEAKPKFDQQAQEEYAAANPPPTTGNPQDYGAWMAGMGEHIGKSWDAMGGMGQLAFGLGVPMALIGMMSGNIGGFLMGALGLGAAGIAGAAGGMFGPESQRGFGQMIDYGAQALGMNVPQGPKDMSRLIGDDAVGNIQKDVAKAAKPGIFDALGVATSQKARADRQAVIKTQLADVDAVQQLAGMPEQMAIPFIMAKHQGPDGQQASPEVARQIYQNALATSQQLSDPESEMAKQVAMGRQFDADPDAYINAQTQAYKDKAQDTAVELAKMTDIGRAADLGMRGVNWAYDKYQNWGK